MACDATTLITGVAAQNYYGFEDRSLLLAVAGALTQSTGITAAQAMAGAASNNYYGLSDHALEESILALCSP